MNTGTDLAISGSVAVFVVLLSLAFNRFRQTCGARETVRGFQDRFPLGLVTCLVLFFAHSAAKAQVGRVIAQKTFPSVVLLTMEQTNGGGRYLGSGFFVREGIVATNFHVVRGAAKGFARVVGQKTEYEVAGIVGIDRERDLVLLSVPGAEAPSLPLGDSSRVAAGDEVYVAGNPEGLEGTFSQGIVGAVRQVGSRTLIQVTAPISPGSSGGPVLNSRGEVIGIAVATLESGQNLNFAVPASYLASLLTQLKPVRPLFVEAGPTQPQTNAAREQDKLQHWLGTWVFVGPVKQLTACAPNTFVPTDVPNYSFKILTISPSGEVAAQAEHPATAGESKAESIRNPKPDWSGSATDRSLVLTMDPIPPGTVLRSSYLQAVKNLADADRNYAKVLKDMEKHYQPEKAMWQRLKDGITGHGGSKTPQGAPAPAPQPGGTIAKLKAAAGRLEAHREGDRYSVEFTYYEAWSWGDMDCHTTKKFLGSMGRP